MQRMAVQSWGTDANGRQILDISTPSRVPAELDTIRNKIGFISNALNSASTGMINFGKNTQWAGRQLTVGFSVPVAMFAGLAGALAYTVDKEMVRIMKVYDTTTTSMIDREKELSNLRLSSMKVAMDAARQYGMAVTDTLKIEADLAATGLTGEKLIGATKETARIATLGEIDPTKAIEMTIAVQTAFRDTIKTTNDLTDAFNYFNALENSTSLSLQDIAEATPRAATGIAQLGGTVQDLGTLLVSMKEAGVDAAEGANAIKSASTRILNPVPKAIKLYEQYGISLENISKESGANLFKFLTLLGKEQQKIQGPTEEETKRLRAQGVAALFGTYQNNRLTASLVNIGDAYAGVSNQTSRAMEMAKKSAKDLAAIAEGELAVKATSASGKFQIALQSIKGELSELGQPLLAIASDIIGVLSNVIAKFNGLGDGTKKFLLVTTIFIAMAGPLIMLTGLFFNLAGHFLKGIALVGMLSTRFKIFTIAEKAATIITQKMNEALAGQIHPVSTLSQELAALSAAYDKATMSATKHFEIAGGAAAVGGKSAAAAKSGMSTTSTGLIIPASTAKQLKEQEVTTAKTTSNIKAGSVAMGAMNVALLGTLVTSGKLQEVLGAATTGLFAFTMIAETSLGAKLGAAIAGSSATATGALARMATGARAFGSLLLGPWGLVAAAAVGTSYLIWRAMKRPQEQQEAINRSTAMWVETLGVVEKKYDKIDFSLNQYADKSVTTAEIAAKITETDDGKKLVDKLKNDMQNSDIDAVRATAASEYVKILMTTNATAEDAKRSVEALYLAAESGSEEAARAATEISQLFKGDLRNIGMLGKLWNIQLADAFSGSAALLDEKAEGIATGVEKAIQMATDSKQMDEILLNFKTSLDGTAKDVWMKELPNELQSAMSNLTPEDGLYALKKVLEAQKNGQLWQGGMGIQAPDLPNLEKYQALIETVGNMSVEQQNNALNALAYEQQIIDLVAQKLNITEKVASIEDLMRTHEYKVATVSLENVEKRVRMEIAAGKIAMANAAAYKNTDPAKYAREEAEYLARVNDFLTAVGLEKIPSLYDSIAVEQAVSKAKQEAITEEIKDSAAAVDALIEKFAEANGEAAKTALSNLAGAAADRIAGAFDASQAAESSALDNRISAHQNALDQRGDSVGRKYDNLIDKTNKFYDARIKTINGTIEAEEKADKTRQRIFDAEIARITKLAEAQNRNIDFNVALNQGNYDEAAKIQNDAAAASATGQMEADAAKAEAATEKLRDRLEKQIERLETKRDNKVDSLEKARENANRAISIEKEKYSAISAIQKQSLQEKQAREKAQFEKELELLRTYIPKNKADLVKHMNDLAKRYDTFGGAYAETAVGWGAFIRDEMTNQMALAAVQLKNQVNWQGAGFDAGINMIKGMAAASGLTEQEFRKSLGLEEAKDRPKEPQRFSKGRSRTSVSGLTSLHGGGQVGGGNSNRTGFSGGISNQEALINALKGEYVVNKGAVEKYGVDTFDSLNSGKFGTGGMGVSAGFMAKSMTDLMAGAFEGMKKSGGAGMAFVQGSGGKSRVINGLGISQGIHPVNAVDIRANVGTPVYAATDGVVTASYDMFGSEPDRAHNGNGYRSYGRVVKVNHGDWSSLYAHLSQRAVSAGQMVRGGATIGRSGDTGNSSGPHLHFGAEGSNPYAYLKKGGTLRYDDTQVLAHKGERVLSAPLTKKLDQGIDNIANGGWGNVTVDLRGAVIRDEIDFKKAVKEAMQEVEKKKGIRRVVN